MALTVVLPAVESRELRFHGYAVTGEGIRHQATGRTVMKEAGPARAWLVAARGPVRGEWKQALTERGARLEGYVAEGGYLVSFSAPVAEVHLSAVPGALFAVPLLAEMKIDAAIGAGSDAGEVRLVAHLFREAELGPVVARARLAGIEVSGSVIRAGKQRIGVRCAVSEVEAVARTVAGWDEVFAIERDPGIQLANNQAVRIVQSGSYLGPVGLWERGVLGAGQVIAVCDTGLDADSCFFRESSEVLPPANAGFGTVLDGTRRKVIAVDFLDGSESPGDPMDWDTQGHGTAVAGSACGSRIDDPTSASVFNGMAPLAQLLVQDAGFAVDNCSDLPALGCPLLDFTPVLQQAYDQGARVHNNSWGDRENFFPHNTYTAACADVDAFTWDHPGFLCVFAGGNDGAIDGVVDSPGVAKNALSVGGTGNGSGADAITSFSSRGPASDGRIKPDLVAPASVTTADSDEDVGTGNCATRVVAGTSLSTPLVAGAAALVRDYLTQGFWPSGAANPADATPDPSAALVKAVLINSCVDVASASDIPGADQGWGRVNLNEGIHFAGDSRRLFVLDEGAGFSGPDDPMVQVEIQVMTGLPLKVTLVWSDFPATPGSEVHLVNDLDLSVSQGSTVYRGNAFSGGFSVAGGSADRVNNVEQVWLSAPVPGTYDVRVEAFEIPEPGQGFGLVITGDFSVVGATGANVWWMY